ncbi:hypothetical protein G9C85_15410 [Halorubellus sp. JP-L1]|uniref:hypothetical protein n=1 Tax=Halorubellus sp. JP-L1 TaxID=2715753 RepID=UPI00140E49D5|nr:hypothetical protein [Halorubellus sp. JP-L1]NHN43007.1 hypothetical protein [Halorubellus sp. JP-L1]
MSQSATKLVKDALESKVAQADAKSRESRTITRSELEDVVREGVREGLSEYEREQGRGQTEDVEARSDASASDESSSAGGGVGALVMLGLFVAAVVYLRRRSQRAGNSSGT